MEDEGFTNETKLYNLFINPISDSQYQVELIKTGDYVWTARLNDFRHGFFIVGWGPITTCDYALAHIWRFETDENQLYLSHGEAAARYFDDENADDIRQEMEGIYVIPYIVDFPGPFGEQKQRPRPRPFYCAMFNDGTGDDDYFNVNGGFMFNTFPDFVTIKIHQLYFELGG